MSRHHLAEGAAERRGGERTDQAGGAGHVVDRGPRLQPFEQPEARLGEGERE
ncbi:MAG TPA: hypothetical protein VFE33_12095 [Thermoanaerobaculia bacterium]|nr:hypothetical protein [Thermoanaerobaculia bacterium]